MKTMKLGLLVALVGCGGDALTFDENGCPLMDGHSARVEWAATADVPSPPKSLSFRAAKGAGFGYVVKDDASREGRAEISSDCGIGLDTGIVSASTHAFVGVSAAWMRDHWEGSTNPGRTPVSLFPE